jgi:hypothetical protein
MTLQSSASAGDPLKFSEIQAEFTPQGSASNFRAYLKGAGIVQSNDIVPNVPTSGTMNILNFLGAECLHATLNNFNAGIQDIILTRTSVAPGTAATAKVGIQLNNDGSAIYYYATQAIPTTNFTSFTWKTGGGSSGNYYAYMYAPTGDSFSVNAGTDTALALSSTRNWRLDASAIEEKSLTSTLEIRNSSNEVLVSKTLRFTATAQSND